MRNRYPSFLWCATATLAFAFLAATTVQLAGAEWRAGYQPAVFAIEHARLVLEPGRTVDDGLLVVRQGVIEYVGKYEPTHVPADALRYDGKGLTVYAGFIDAFTTRGIDPDQVKSKVGPGRSIDYGSYSLALTPPDNRRGMTPELQASELVSLNEATVKALHRTGLTAALTFPPGAIVSGQGVLISHNGLPRREAIVRAPIGLHVSFGRISGFAYPMTLMAQIAHLRQMLLDARYYEARWQFFQEHGGPRPPTDVALEAIRAIQKRKQAVFWEANKVDEIDRVLRLSKEFGLRVVLVGGRDAWQRAEALAKAAIPVVLRVDFPEEPKPAKAVERGDDGLPNEEPKSPRIQEDLRRKWAEQLRCAKVLVDHGVPVAFSTTGLEKPEQFMDKVRQIVKQGLPEEKALAALTTTPAQLLGVEDKLGKLAAGYLAHVVAWNGDPLSKKATAELVIADGVVFQYGKERRIGFAVARKPEKDAQKEEPKKGTVMEEVRLSDLQAKKPEQKAKQEPKSEATAKQEEQKKESPAEPYPSELKEDRQPKTRTGGNVLIKNATVLTITRGTLRDTDILVRNGKIVRLGKNLKAPDGVVTIDASGLYVMPGIIDTHAHIAIDRGVNEFTLTVVPEVRIKDVIRSDDVSIYRAVAGGCTTARLLHGSANPIGGQDAVIKLKWGKSADEMLLRDAPQGVKFALGENPKRSERRFPDTRLGVEAVIRRAFEEARGYQAEWQRYLKAKANGQLVPEPRRDLRLEALVRILEGRYKIHCHCYRADEILMILNTAARYGIRVQSLQHVLEGYKVAAEIAAHGASTSTFADWWAYKVEAYDAIPHNAAFLLRAGVVSTLKSDSSDLIRHMYQEAAKTLRYGDLTEDEALSLVTINAARQLGLDHRIGSIEVGKDADLAIFNGHPLNGYSRCVMTLIDGEVYFEASDRKPANLGSPRPAEELRARRVTIPPGSTNRPLVLRHAYIVPVVGNPIKNGTVVVQQGKIAGLGGPDLAGPAEAVEIDLGGLHVYPGMINAGGTLGLTEIGAVRETHDYREKGSLNPDLRASIALHPESAWIGVTRTNGVLTALSHPVGQGIAGQGVLFNLNGWVPREMIVRDGITLHIRLPRIPEKGIKDQKYREAVDRLKERFRLAVHYARLKELAREGKVAAPTPDPKLEALAPFAQGKKLVVIHANRYMEIVEAIRFAKELGLKWLLADAVQAWKCPELLKEHGVRVLLGPPTSEPRSDYEPYDAYYATAATLHRHGVPFAIKSSTFGPESATAPRNLPFEAALAVSYGLPAQVGLEAVTIAPARLLGVDDLLGSIEVGKIANLVIADGDILQPATQVKAIVIGGKLLPPVNKQTELYERYLERLRQVRVGEAPLGLERP